MKKTFSFFVFILLLTTLRAQYTDERFDREKIGFDIKPVHLWLTAERNLCELKELINVRVLIQIADQDLTPHLMPYLFTKPEDAPWKISSFKVISGGGSIVNVDGEVAQVRMPAVMPKEKAVVVQATLDPVKAGAGQVQLFTTLYLENNDNVFYFDCPFLGIHNEKYVISSNGGALANADAAAAKAGKTNLPPDVQKKIGQYTMKAATADVSATMHGLDLAAITGNAKAIYAKEADVTSVLLNDDNVSMEDGKAVSKKRMFMISLSIPGKSPGTYLIKSKKEITAAITFPSLSIACACQDDPEEKKRREEAGEKGPSCAGGSIVITAVDPVKKIITGTVKATLESANHATGEIFFSRLQGTFSLPLIIPD